MKLGSSRGMDTKRPRGSERSKPRHELQLTRRSQPPYPWPPEQAQPGVSKPCRTTRVVGQDVGDEFLQARLAGKRRDMAHQRRADAPAVIRIDDRERDLRDARLHDDIATAADDRRPAVFVGYRHQRDMFDEIDIEEVVGLLLRELALHCKEAMVERFLAHPGERRP